MVMNRESGARDAYLDRRELLETWSCHSYVVTALPMTEDEDLLVYFFSAAGMAVHFQGLSG